MGDFRILIGWVFAIVAFANCWAAIVTGFKGNGRSLLYTLNFLLLGYVVEVLL